MKNVWNFVQKLAVDDNVAIACLVALAIAAPIIWSTR